MARSALFRLALLMQVAWTVRAITEIGDVNGLKILYGSWNSPRLSGWNSGPGGDPCGESWQGVLCTGPRVTSIKLPGQNLGGSLGYALDQLRNLKILDLSNNQLSQAIPYQLPPQLQEMYLSNNQLTGLPYSLKDLWSLTKIDVSHNQLIGTIPDVFQNFSNLNLLDVSFNQLTGSLPSSFAGLISISVMHVQNNKLSGDINVLSDLPLADLNVENNQFNGWVPSSLRSIPNLRDGGNNFSTSPAPPPPPFTPPPPPPRAQAGGKSPGTKSSSRQSKEAESGGLSQGKMAGIIVALVLAAVIAGLVAVCYMRKRKRKPDLEKKMESSWLTPHNAPAKVKELKMEQKTRLSPPEKVLKPPPLKTPAAERSPIKHKNSKASVAATSYSVADLQAATNSFAQENLLGEGSLGRVYRAELQNGTPLAVKKLDASGSTVQTNEEFLAFVSTIARLRHTNVTELVGYCAEHGQRLLVYEYFNRGTLHEMLHVLDETSKRLSWNQRVKIALGAARALEYLHEVCSPAVVHRNFKSANILLDDDMSPHLTDCGLAALSSTSSDRQVAAQMLGSFGYSAPEFAMSGVYTVKSDVYSFGVVMLELLTGRKPLDSSRARSEQSLVRWATPQLHDIDALSKMVDPALKGIYPAKSLSRFADVISSCVQPEPEFRPPMSEVVQSLVRLMQRASLSKRSSGDELGGSQRSMHDPPSDY
ncbi:protein STRUBBELIG-RECEPTOR FAMILY 8 [Selaginella moellendorffii]|uniref:protein STRUBBELIG-RECEPTOR FAMILY 8 n=1 Tax=Selaginella moellendorffii TaxID=88036 RepID=UPI000D1D01CC|nr:protein STRUBBELIG-RECEPTOR FAMILY 8 [Selaginella moellendorffii]XP_024525274.1 protein STRUBBELIG-RECEPTOR FAMILY 8 [Selaginella moellendorffii]|eukprot:XP_002965192.2 protein STRUBBELIG-RECEPTOR FAMILY 8 [Selaginella moellendorffii]